MGPFNLQPVEGAGPSVSFEVELRASEPFLDHHRPGGHPLFGTAMGIELMCRGATAATSTTKLLPARLSDVTVRSPIIVHDATAVAFVTATPTRAPDGAAFACTITTHAKSNEVHFTAIVLLAANPRPTPHAARPNHGDTFPVNAAAIYSLFFHGPAFQVIAAAGLVGATMVSRIATQLPALSSGNEDNDETWVAMPRLIEACLQTAGLLDIATRSKMMIPHGIDDIELFETRPSPNEQLHATARRTLSRSGTEAVDIDLQHPDGSIVLRVRGYETRQLSFPTNQLGINTLNDAFQRHPNQP